MSTLTRTHTRTHTVTTFSDPYKKCLACGAWIDGFFKDEPGPVVVAPCEHQAGYRDLCPSWGPVDGCDCAGYTARHPDDPMSHEMRPPVAGDGHTY